MEEGEVFVFPAFEDGEGTETDTWRADLRNFRSSPDSAVLSRANFTVDILWDADFRSPLDNSQIKHVMKWIKQESMHPTEFFSSSDPKSELEDVIILPANATRFGLSNGVKIEVSLYLRSKSGEEAITEESSFSYSRL